MCDAQRALRVLHLHERAVLYVPGILGMVCALYLLKEKSRLIWGRRRGSVWPKGPCVNRRTTQVVISSLCLLMAEGNQDCRISDLLSKFLGLDSSAPLL
jgi:hypothetical protein